MRKFKPCKVCHVEVIRTDFGWTHADASWYPKFPYHKAAPKDNDDTLVKPILDWSAIEKMLEA